jgi:branched-chain amino acid transport system permease protein
VSTVLVLQALVNGILLGGLYACIAVGFSLIWGVMNLINLAHGSFVLVGAYITAALNQALGLDPFLSIPISASALFGIGYAIQRGLINLVISRTVFTTLIFTFGLNMLLVNLLLLAFTADVRGITVPYSGIAWQLGGVRVPGTRLAVFAVAMLLTVILAIFANRTRLGAAIKATSFDVEAARLVGIDVDHVYAITFAIGASMAGAAGALIAVTLAFSPVLGDNFTMKAFVVVVLGGLGSIPGTLIAGVILGIVDNLSSILFNPGYRDAISFGLLLGVLVLSPRGLFGKRFYAEIRT